MISSIYVLAWFKAFLLTQTLEVPLTTYLFRNDESVLWRRIGLLLCANLLSHPAVWFVYPALPMSPYLAQGLSEVWAVLSEMVFFVLCFRSVKPIRAFGVAALVNGFSYGIGLILYEIPVIRDLLL